MTLDVFEVVPLGIPQGNQLKKPLRPINRLPRTDRYKKTTYNRLFEVVSFSRYLEKS